MKESPYVGYITQMWIIVYKLPIINTQLFFNKKLKSKFIIRVIKKIMKLTSL